MCSPLHYTSLNSNFTWHHLGTCWVRLCSSVRGKVSKELMGLGDRDKIRELGNNILKSKCKLENLHHTNVHQWCQLACTHVCTPMCTNSVGSIRRYVFSKPLRAGWSILIRTVGCSADVRWAAVCRVLCSYWFGIGVLPCFTCHSVI